MANIGSHVYRDTIHRKNWIVHNKVIRIRFFSQQCLEHLLRGVIAKMPIHIEAVCSEQQSAGFTEITLMNGRASPFQQPCCEGTV